MAFYKWNDRFKIGIVSIDKQHKQLFDMIEIYYQSFKAGKSKEGLAKLLDDLTDYTKFHFTFEEKYFEKYNYAEAEAHTKEHKGFISELEELKNRVEKHKMVLPVEVGNFLGEWLIRHINGSDKKYLTLFKDKNIV